jgi:hypothetical protein
LGKAASVFQLVSVVSRDIITELTTSFQDRGGTFTDCVARVPGKDDIVIKILSVDPRNYADAPSEAIRQVLQQYYGKTIPRGSKLDLTDIEWIRMGTTVATNALLERKGERTALLITEGFKVSPPLKCLPTFSTCFVSFDLPAHSKS